MKRRTALVLACVFASTTAWAEGFSDRAFAAGKALSALRLDGLVEVTGVRRKGARSQRPDPDWVFEPGDVVVLLGRPEDLALADRRLLQG